jgi:2-polyprenyl-6-methoxyphenol hydroxylase-like FAD-dependent oxidoreductase/polyisoprenoid-binding protein YceI
MVLSYLLARAGVNVVTLEKHADFLRDFRGDTLHPSSMEIIDELALLDDLLELPVDRAPFVRARSVDLDVIFADFRRLRTRTKFLAFLPQNEFLDFFASKGQAFPGFDVRMSTSFTDLIEDASGRVIGVRADGPDGPMEIRCDLVVAADGRGSRVREKAGLPLKDLGAPFDVFWFRLPREPDDVEHVLGRFENGRLLVLFNRNHYWQVAYMMPKGGFDELREEGLDSFKRTVAHYTPFADERVEVITSWDDVPLLTVRMDRLLEWYRPGLLCIGDAAHAMSAIAGIGINLAIHDAVAAANVLAAPLRDRTLSERHLRRFQRRRELPTRFYQRFQIIFQHSVVKPSLKATPKPIPTLRLVNRFPVLTRLSGRIIGIGFRPEHVDSALVLARKEVSRPALPADGTLEPARAAIGEGNMVSPTLEEGTWRLASERSRVKFTASHVFGALPVRGAFARMDGVLTIGNGGSRQAEAVLEAASLTTGPLGGMRDWHLRSAHFLNAKRHPQIHFQSTSIEQSGGSLTVKGRLTIKGITRPVTLTGRLTEQLPDVIEVVLSGEIRRGDFRVGILPMKLMVAERVKLDLELTVRRSTP